VCRYAGEASDRYLAWFALEGHADSVTITRLCASLGMCARHTRALMSQPGAARRLTALHRYLILAARDRLAGRAAPPERCPACEHGDGAAGRALDTLLDGLADDLVRDRYRELGGLCSPHLRAASARADHRVVTWLAQAMTAAVIARPPDPGWLAGTGHDADVRFVLRGALPATALAGAGTCTACLAAGRSEAGDLARIVGTSDRSRPDRRLLLCSGHLSDLIVLAGWQEAGSVLAWQARSLAVALAGPARGAASRASGSRPAAAAVRPAPARPESSRSLGWPGDRTRRDPARGHPDRRAGPDFHQQHLGAPPPRPGPGDDRVAAGSGVP
jgi:hypothetical protein